MHVHRGTRGTWRHAALTLVLTLVCGAAACGDKDDDNDDDDDGSGGGRTTGTAATDCDGRPVSEAETLATQLQLLGYGDFSSDSGGRSADSGSSAEPGTIVTDAETWAALVATVDGPVSLAPDFETDVVFVHHWSDGGCAEPFQYDAFRWDDTVRLRLFQPGRDRCDAHFPQMDLILVQGAADAADLGFCP